MSTTQDKLTSATTVGLQTLVVEITDYVGNEQYTNHIFVKCDNEGLVLGKENLILVGFATSTHSDFSPCSGNDVMHADILEAEYGFLEVAKAFAKGKRGTYKTVKEDSVNLYDVLSPHIMKYCEFVIFSHSGATMEEIRWRLYSLMGSIICSIDKKTLRKLSSDKDGPSLTRFLLVALQKNTSLFFERNPVTY